MSNLTDRLGGARTSLAFKAPVRCATTANITLAGFQTIDGVTLADGDANLRVLVRSQTDAKLNGIWVAQSGNWTRARDFDGASDIVKGTRVYVANGTTNQDTGWVVTTADPIVIGTSNLSFVIPGDIAREGYVDFDEQASVASPSSNVARLYAYDDGGTTRLAFKDASGNVTGLGAFVDTLAIYGVDRTGATDQSAIMQTIVDQEDVVYIYSDAVVKMDTPPSITSATRFEGIGRTSPGGTAAKATFVAGTTTNDMFLVRSNGVAFNQIDIRGIAGRTTSANVTAKQGRGIVVGPDSRTVTGGISNTPPGTTVTLSSGSFTSADVGARIHIPGAYNGTSTPTIVSQAGSTCVVSIAADNTVSGVTITIAHAYEDFQFTNGSVHSHSIGIDCRNAGHYRISGSRVHGFYAINAECEIGSDIGDSTISENEIQTSGASGTRGIYHSSGGSPKIFGNKFQNAEIQLEMEWNVGASGAPSVVLNIFENCSSKHILVKDDGSGTKTVENFIIGLNTFNGAPTTMIEFSDSHGTGWCRGVEIIGNRFTSSTAGTFLLMGRAVDGAHIAANTFRDSTGSGSTGIDIKADSANGFVGVNYFHGIASLIANASPSWRFDVHAHAQLSTVGFAVRSATNAWVTREFGGTTNEINITNGTGAAANPTWSLASTLELAAKTVNVGDSTLSVKDTADATKVAKFEVGTIATGTTRTFTFPNASGTLQLFASSIELPSGSAGSPSLYATGDTNTGLWFPAADTIALSTGGTERMRVDSAGRVGIGTTPSVANEFLTVYSTAGGTLARLQSTASTCYLNLQNSSGSFLVGVSGFTGFMQAPNDASSKFEFQKGGGGFVDALCDAIRPASYTVGTVPSASTKGAGAMIYISNESGGAITAFSDATNWRRHSDRAVIS